MVTRLRVRAGAAEAARAGRSFLSSRRYEVLFADARLVASALGRMEQFDDNRLSLTDCVSFEGNADLVPGVSAGAPPAS